MVSGIGIGLAFVTMSIGALEGVEETALLIRRRVPPAAAAAGGAAAAAPELARAA